VEIEVQNTRADYISFYKYYFFKRKIGIKVFCVLYVSFAGLTRYSNGAVNWHDTCLRAPLLFILSFSFFFLLPYLTTLWKFRKRALDDSSLLATKKVTLSDNGFSIVSESENNFWKYETIKVVEMNQSYIFIVLINAKVYLIPLRYFSSESEAVNFLGVIDKKTKVARSVPNGDYLKRKKLYFLGLLGVVPVVGVIIGIKFIYQGYYRYKDNLLIGLGIAMIAFWPLFIYSTQFMDASKLDVDFSGVAEAELNGIFKSVESYKTRNGVYPESIEQLQTKGLIFYDPMIPKNTNKDSLKFHFRNYGNKYTLFSVGQDGIPYTKDDIYPNLANSDTSKIGLIRVSKSN
jgi:hypothetical protein